ncbi:unnamed protein product [Caenorhabditis brenneri]
MGFPILNLPLVPFRDILRMLEFKDLISLSFCSQQSRVQTKQNMYKLKDWEICVAVDWRNGIIFRKGNVEEHVLGVLLYEDFVNRPNWRSRIQYCQGFHVAMNVNGYLSSFWLNIANGMYGVWKYVTELFRKDVEMIRFYNSTTWAMNLPMMFGQRTVPKTHFKNEGNIFLQRNSLIKVLEECSSEHLQITNCLFDDRDIRIERFGNYRIFEVNSGLWITVNQLTRMKCSKISIGWSKWNNSDANKFLKHWIYNRDMPNLEWLNIRLWCGHVREQAILDELGEFVTRTGNKRRFQKYNENFTFNGLEIRNKSGSRASIHVDDGSRTLRMAVWK